MDEVLVARYRDVLEAELEALEKLQAGSADARKPVELDQVAVGRLSRMDAMQLQAMAKASNQRREQLKARIRAALTRMDEGAFGECVECGEPIPAKPPWRPTGARTS